MHASAHASSHRCESHSRVRSSLVVGSSSGPDLAGTSGDPQSTTLSDFCGKPLPGIRRCIGYCISFSSVRRFGRDQAETAHLTLRHLGSGVRRRPDGTWSGRVRVAPCSATGPSHRARYYIQSAHELRIIALSLLEAGAGVLYRRRKHVTEEEEPQPYGTSIFGESNTRTIFFVTFSDSCAGISLLQGPDWCLGASARRGARWVIFLHSGITQ